MSTDIKVPALGESVTEATIARWFKKEGEAVKADEPLVELETDKVTVEVPSPASGVLTSIGVASEGNGECGSHSRPDRGRGSGQGKGGTCQDGRSGTGCGGGFRFSIRIACSAQDCGRKED
jgi:2-oxoglutarate dehydrogenase E2 component (dihydrolipoamide succinyltransferase)